MEEDFREVDIDEFVTILILDEDIRKNDFEVFLGTEGRTNEELIKNKFEASLIILFESIYQLHKFEYEVMNGNLDNYHQLIDWKYIDEKLDIIKQYFYKIGIGLYIDKLEYPRDREDIDYIIDSKYNYSYVVLNNFTSDSRKSFEKCEKNYLMTKPSKKYIIPEKLSKMMATCTIGNIVYKIKFDDKIKI